MQTRYWVHWRPIPGRAWVLVDAETGRTVVNGRGYALRFRTPEEATVRATRLQHARGR